MATLSELLAERTTLSGDQVRHLKRVVAEWQLISDLSFADFLMWVRQDAPDVCEGEDLERRFSLGEPNERLVCVAQCRPTTSATLLPGDMVGTEVGEPLAGQYRRCFADGRIIEPEDPMWLEYVPTRREVIPVWFGGVVIAVFSRYLNLLQPRLAGNLETAYTSAGDALCQMVCAGSFPEQVDRGPGPRVGDGFIRLAETGALTYASPNASSALRRIGWTGGFMGSELVEILRETMSDSLAAGDVAQALSAVLAGRRAEARLEVEANGAAATLRVVGLRQSAGMAGAVVLICDITELRHRDRAIISKDATIREIHHRVKNNLQSVSALLRMQARRSECPEVRRALEDSVRRIGSIALVHDTLSLSMDEHVSVDEVVDKLIPMLSDLAVPNASVVIRREGRFGTLEADRAMSLVTILTELVQNSMEHAFKPGDKGHVVIVAERQGKWLKVVVVDDGVGFPDGFALNVTKRLGLRIAVTLAESELSAVLTLGKRKGGGAAVTLKVPVTPGIDRRWGADYYTARVTAEVASRHSPPEEAPRYQQTPAEKLLGSPCWIELLSSDVTRSLEFYGGVFGWEFLPQTGLPNYHLIVLDGTDFGGIALNNPSWGQPDTWLIDLLVEDLAAMCAKVVAAGGKILVPPEVVHLIGMRALAADPTGGIFWLWEPLSHKGYGRSARPGLPLWHEFMAKDYLGAQNFFGEVFGLTFDVVEDSEELAYSIAQTPDAGAVAGVLDAQCLLGEGAASMWSVHFNSVDVDDTVARAVALGGRVVDPARDTPYGRLAKLADPDGVVFNVIKARVRAPAFTDHGARILYDWREAPMDTQQE